LRLRHRDPRSQLFPYTTLFRSLDRASVFLANVAADFHRVNGHGPGELSGVSERGDELERDLSTGVLPGPREATVSVEVLQELGLEFCRVCDLAGDLAPAEDRDR